MVAARVVLLGALRSTMRSLPVEPGYATDTYHSLYCVVQLIPEAAGRAGGRSECLETEKPQARCLRDQRSHGTPRPLTVLGSYAELICLKLNHFLTASKQTL